MKNSRRFDLGVCSIPGCQTLPTGRFYEGFSYCNRHYEHLIEEDLGIWFDAWRPPSTPPHRFRYLLGRVVDEGLWITGGSYLSAARIRNRAFNFSKTIEGCTFEIVRHPGAFVKGYIEHRITQIWCANISQKCVMLVATRPFMETDFDR